MKNSKTGIDLTTKQNHDHQCACGCSGAYDNIDDEQFEKAFQLHILPNKHLIIAAIAAIILSAVVTAIYLMI